ncbi:DUF6886 family protein [Mucilaginibacter sp. X4EP1]|jgi:hypothetical protein|uniref:DUF6886 family protein n=1 Tax=Mucilaginibacter sp. X4EP1 TaxID=2723092 RepID=UPI0021680E5D|nr:DUF6886 family protein [Mucilaginibacter sp. X4EP1]MCS3813050.1 hypothetical protein [Mucilaginibacter sp. X4EP1]
MSERLFHISEEPGIKIFEPRPSPSNFDAITGNVVFAVSEKLLHNYLLPRDCPRVTYYASPQTTKVDRDTFFKHSAADYVMAIESAWFNKIANTTLYCYEFSPDSFVLLDECAGYYISYQAVAPISVTIISNPVEEILKGNVELRFTPDLNQLADEVKRSSLNFSLIRMRNAGKRII